MSLGDLLKFTALASLLAIFMDAAVAHAMLWGNDPYWTYWVTDTLLMATVFGLGTAWFGMGLVRGAVITAVHMVLLTVYYWSFSPIGLPSHPEWLDLEHTWLTGLPVHFTVYYLGYVLAYWLWQQRASLEELHANAASSKPARLAAKALLLSIGIVVGAGALQTIIFGEFPGLTWFVMRIAVAFPFTLAWWVIAGSSRAASVGGGLMIGLLLTTYSHYLGPTGLPNASFRALAENPPPAAVQWLSYREKFLIMFPATVLVAIAGFWIASRPYRAPLRLSRAGVVAGSAAAAVLLGLGLAVAPYTGPDADSTVVTASGSGTLVTAAAFDPANGPATLRMSVTNRNSNRTPLPPHDEVEINAVIPTPDGATYDVVATRPMVADPQGRFTTWYGVGFDVWHHGRSGIGTTTVPPTKSNVAAYALGNISADGELVAAGVPVHVMTSSEEGARLELHVGDPEFPLPGIPDGSLRVVWADYEGGYDQTSNYARYAWGAGVLIALLGFALAVARRAPRGDH